MTTNDTTLGLWKISMIVEKKLSGILRNITESDDDDTNKHLNWLSNATESLIKKNYKIFFSFGKRFDVFRQYVVWHGVYACLCGKVY